MIRIAIAGTGGIAAADTDRLASFAARFGRLTTYPASSAVRIG